MLLQMQKLKLEDAYANLVKRGDIQSVKDELDTINKLKEKIIQVKHGLFYKIK